MSSKISPSTIDATFPKATVNQSSSGFRTNFLAIQNAFKETRLEINDLLDKVIVSAPLAYGSSNVYINDFGGMNNSNLALTNYAKTLYDHGQISTDGALSIDFSAGSVHTCNLIASTVQTVQVANYGNLGHQSAILSVFANTVPQYLDFTSLDGTMYPYSSVPSAGNSSLYAPQTNNGNLRLDAVDYNYLVEVSSENGDDWFVQVLNPPTQVDVATAVPSTSIGSEGDHPGMIAYNSSYFYVCIAEYDGTTQIWRRSALSSF